MTMTVLRTLLSLLCVLGSVIVLVQICDAQATAEDEIYDILLDANFQFATNLYGEMTNSATNVFLSPYSITAAIGMPYLGSRAATKSQIEERLGFSTYEDYVGGVFQLIHDSVNNPASVYILKEANRLFTQADTNLQETFLNDIREVFHAGVGYVEFANNQQTVETINSWVERHTQNLISDLLRSGDVTADTVLILVNALYFQANWTEVFDVALTSDQPFYLDATQQTSCEMMTRTGTWEIGSSPVEDLDAAVVKFAYQDPKVSLYAFLPNRDYDHPSPLSDLTHLEGRLNAERIQQAISSVSAPPGNVRVNFPKFSITHEVSLKETLQHMGLDRMFNPDQADFTGIDNGEYGLVVDDVIHKSFLTVDEVGSSAAAATAVTMTRMMPMTINFNRPFMFLIHVRRDNDHLGPYSDMATGRGTVLFMGRVTNPGTTIMKRAHQDFPVQDDPGNNGGNGGDGNGGDGNGDGGYDYKSGGGAMFMNMFALVALVFISMAFAGLL